MKLKTTIIIILYTNKTRSVFVIQKPPFERYNAHEDIENNRKNKSTTIISDLRLK